MTLRTQIEPLLEDFKKSNGKGNVNVANLTLVKIVEALVSHIEAMTTGTPLITAVNPGLYTAAQAPVNNGWHELNRLSGHAGWMPPTAAQAPGSTGDIVGKVVIVPEKSINYSLERKASEEALAMGIDVEQEIVSALAVEGRREVLLDAARALHEENYLPGPDHDAIVDHILHPPASEPEKAVVPEFPSDVISVDDAAEDIIAAVAPDAESEPEPEKPEPMAEKKKGRTKKDAV